MVYLQTIPTLPKKWVYGEKVPFTESTYVEFKRVAIFPGLFIHTAVTNSGLPKYKETLIGFLNSGGGFLFMGILDDGTILGVEGLTESALDKLNLWVDSCFNSLVYKDGNPIDPSLISLTIHTFPVEESNTHIVAIEATNKGLPMDIMTRSGTIIYRLNASNYKVCVEPVYRKSDVKGMITSIQSQMQLIIDEKHRVIRELKEKHTEEVQIIRARVTPQDNIIYMYAIGIICIIDIVYIVYTSLGKPAYWMMDVNNVCK